jgi:Ca2+-binding EF-hand superfamily protein
MPGKVTENLGKTAFYHPALQHRGVVLATMFVIEQTGRRSGSNLGTYILKVINMTKLQNMLLASVLVAGTVALPQMVLAAPKAVAQTAEDKAALVQAEFNKLDLNKDGKVSATEYIVSARMAFKSIDLNKDRSLSVDELRAAQLLESGAQTSKHTAKSDVASLTKVKLADSDHDGMLSEDEYVATARAQFDKMDKNKDGFLSLDELTLNMAALAKVKKPAI